MDPYERAFTNALARIDAVPVAPPGTPLRAAGPAQVVPTRRRRALPLALAAAALLLVALLVPSMLPRAGVPATPAGTPSGGPTLDGVGTWKAIAPGPLSPRWDASSIWVNGRFLVVGGHATVCPPMADCPMHPVFTDGALYDPGTNTWGQIAPLPSVDMLLTLTAVGESAYAISHRAGSDEQTLLRYDTASDAWSSHPVPGAGSHSLVATDRAVVLIAGTDENGPAADLAFDPLTGTFTPLPTDPLGPSFSRAGVWTGSELILTAHELVDNPGADRPSLTRLAALDPTLTTWREQATSEILDTVAVHAGDRVVFPQTGTADGGAIGNWGRHYPFGGILDPTSQSWTPLPPSPGPGGLLRPGSGSHTPLATRSLVVVDGNLLDPATLAWTPVPPPGGALVGVAVAAGPDSIMAWGGGDATTASGAGYLLLTGR